jgi:hypothetical protein
LGIRKNSNFLHHLNVSINLLPNRRLLKGVRTDERPEGADPLRVKRSLLVTDDVLSLHSHLKKLRQRRRAAEEVANAFRDVRDKSLRGKFAS